MRFYRKRNFMALGYSTTNCKFKHRRVACGKRNEIAFYSPRHFSRDVVPNLTMKKRYIFMLILLITFSCSQSNNSEKIESQTLDAEVKSLTENEGNKTVKATISKKEVEKDPVAQKADKLLKYYELAKTSDSPKNLEYGRNFFDAFPNSFNEMQELFGYDDQKGAAPLYTNPSGENIIQYFSKLNTIPKDKYYNKYINICINGIWEADNIREAFGIHNRMLNDTEAVCSILEKKSNQEIKSVFRFIFDGPHPQNEDNEKLFFQLQTIIESENKRLGSILIESYNQLMADDDGH